MSKMNKS